jgi:hypothetical protein
VLERLVKQVSAVFHDYLFLKVDRGRLAQNYTPSSSFFRLLSLIF